MASPRIYGLLGRNISYSLSPLIFNSVFKKRGLPYNYVIFDIETRDLKRFVDAVRLLNVAGFNITIPYKEKIIELIDETDDAASVISAANLVTNKDGKLIGYNTDMHGIKSTIESHLNTRLRGQRVAVIGAGGSAKAVLYYLHSVRPETVFLFNRTSERVRAIAKTYEDSFEIETYPLSNLREVIANRDVSIIINATPTSTLSLIDGYAMPRNLRIFDLSYRPRSNPYGKSRIRCDGRFMLAAQASKGLGLLCGVRESAEKIHKMIGGL